MKSAITENKSKTLVALCYLIIVCITAFVSFKIANSNSSKHILIIFASNTFLLAILFFIIKLFKDSFESIGFKKEIKPYIISVFIISIFSMIIFFTSNKLEIGKTMLLLFFVTVVEEMIFRGYAFSQFKKAIKSPFFSLIICTFFLTIFRVFVYSNEIVGIMVFVNQIGISFVIQFFFQEIFVLSDNLMYPITIHYLLLLAIYIMPYNF